MAYSGANELLLAGHPERVDDVLAGLFPAGLEGFQQRRFGVLADAAQRIGRYPPDVPVVVVQQLDQVGDGRLADLDQRVADPCPDVDVRRGNMG